MQYFLAFCLLILSISPSAASVLPSVSEKRSDSGRKSSAEEAEQMNEALQRSATNVSTMKLETITIPDRIKDGVAKPSWLSSWEDAEFGAPAGMFNPVYVPEGLNLTMQAAYYLLSMTGGYWHDYQGHLSKQEAEEIIDEAILLYFDTGSEDIAMAIAENDADKLSGVISAAKSKRPRSDS